MKNILSNIHFAKADLKKDKKSIITYTLNRGNIEQIKWLFDNFEKKDLIDALKNPLKGEWDKKSYNFFGQLLGEKIDEKRKKYAIKTLNPIF